MGSLARPCADEPCGFGEGSAWMLDANADARLGTRSQGAVCLARGLAAMASRPDRAGARTSLLYLLYLLPPGPGLGDLCS